MLGANGEKYDAEYFRRADTRWQAGYGPLGYAGSVELRCTLVATGLRLWLSFRASPGIEKCAGARERPFFTMVRCLLDKQTKLTKQSEL